MKLKNMLKILLILLISFVSLLIIKYLKVFDIVMLVLNILIPVFIGFVYAWILNPLLNKCKYRGLVSVIIFIVIIISLFMFFYNLIPMVYKEVNELVSLLPEVLEFIQLRLYDLGININELDMDLNKVIEYVPSYIIGFIKGCFKYIGSIFIGLIIGLYMSMEFNKINEVFIRLLPKKYKCEVLGIIDKISVEVRKCISGMFIVSFSVFILDSIAFSILKLNSPLLLGFLCGLTDLIPLIGPYIGGGIAILVALSEGKSVIIGTLLFIVIVQIIENYVFQPIVMSKRVKISPLLVIVGLLVFGNLFGIVGMLLSMPIVCIIRVIYLYIDDVKEKCKVKKKFEI